MISILNKSNEVVFTADVLTRDLQEAITSGNRDFSGFIFNGLNLKGVNFSNCMFNDAVFFDCDLRNCNFKDSVLSNVFIDSCKINYVIGDGVVFTNLNITNHLCVLCGSTLAVGCKQSTTYSWMQLNSRSRVYPDVFNDDVVKILKFIKEDSCPLS